MLRKQFQHVDSFDRQASSAGAGWREQVLAIDYDDFHSECDDVLIEVCRATDTVLDRRTWMNEEIEIQIENGISAASRGVDRVFRDWLLSICLSVGRPTDRPTGLCLSMEPFPCPPERLSAPWR